MLRELLRRLVPPDEKAIFAMEDMQLLGGSSVQTMGALAHTRGILEAVAILCGMSMTYVTPQRWKRFYGLGIHTVVVAQDVEPLAPVASHRSHRCDKHLNIEDALRYGTHAQQSAKRSEIAADSRRDGIALSH
jgi:hypothetical protein